MFFWGIIFVVGACMQMVANYEVLLAGRFIGGLGVGASSMLSPQFLGESLSNVCWYNQVVMSLTYETAENSPKSVRGSFVATYNLMIVTSLMIAFFINYGVSLWDSSSTNDRQWRTAMGIQVSVLSSFIS